MHRVLAWASALSLTLSAGSAAAQNAVNASIPSNVTASATVDPVVWRPLVPFVGTWKGTRAGAEGPIQLTRVYATGSANRHLEITETGRKRDRAEVRGMVSFDPQRQALVMRQFAQDGTAADLVLDAAASTNGHVVFASANAEGPRTRITYERTGPRKFVERVEQSANGDSFAYGGRRHGWQPRIPRHRPAHPRTRLQRGAVGLQRGVDHPVDGKEHHGEEEEGQSRGSPVLPVRRGLAEA